MIILQPNTENIIILNTSLVTVSEPYYLFRFEHKESNEVLSCICQPDTEYSQGRESFLITTVASGATGQQIAPVYGDEYNVYVYAQTSAVNTDPESADELVFQGLAKYDRTLTPREVYERSTTTRKIYNR